MPEELPPKAGWRADDWSGGAIHQGHARRRAKAAGETFIEEDPAHYVSPPEGAELHGGPADGDVLPESSELSEVQQPWHQQATETHEAYQAFWTYVTMGPKRNLMRVCHQLRKAKSSVDRWSSKHHWRMRTYRYLLEQDRVRQQNYRHELADMAERHAKFARVMSGKIIARLKNMDVAELTPKDMAHWFKITTELERQALDADKLRRPETTLSGVRRHGALARSYARAMREDDPENNDMLGDRY